eukprot:gene17321-22088_t
MDIFALNYNREIPIKVWRRTFSANNYKEDELLLKITPEMSNRENLELMRQITSEKR